MRVPIGSFSKRMNFLVRIRYSLSRPFGMEASCFNSSRRSPLVFTIAVIEAPLPDEDQSAPVDLRLPNEVGLHIRRRFITRIGVASARPRAGTASRLYRRAEHSCSGVGSAVPVVPPA